eukprot:987395-Pleurochrysis_carterae.AAC.3
MYTSARPDTSTHSSPQVRRSTRTYTMHEFTHIHTPKIETIIHKFPSQSSVFSSFSESSSAAVLTPTCSTNPAAAAKCAGKVPVRCVVAERREAVRSARRRQASIANATLPILVPNLVPA